MHALGLIALKDRPIADNRPTKYNIATINSFPAQTPKQMSTTLLHRLARLSGTIVLLFLVVVLIGATSGDSSDPRPMAWSIAEVLSLMLYPVLPLAGLAIAYKWPLAGGVIATVGLITSVALDPALLQATFFILLVPGVLYIIGQLSARQRLGRTGRLV